MVITPMTALAIAAAAGALVAAGEWAHHRRMRRVARLAFGSAAAPAMWTSIATPLRVLGMTSLVWGLLMLATLDPRFDDGVTPLAASKHLLIAFDVSPSMHLEDAGPDRSDQSRSVWAGELVQGVLDRLDPATTRISMMAFYTTAMPIFRETYDKEVVSNALDGLPLYAAFEPGPTRLQEGVVAALDMAKAWMPGSATLLVVSDGDTLTSSAPPRLPPAIADVIVIGVGDPHRPQTVGGHASRQDTTSLKQLATRLGGVYHQGNTKHLPSAVLDGLTMIQPRLASAAGLRELALLTAACGATALALIGPALALLGMPRRRRAVASRAGGFAT
jgi:Ca-activated chloride channel family protein